VVFKDVQGLKPGNTIRMGGVDVGTVGQVRMSEDPKDPQLYVELNIAKEAASRIRQGSVVKIDSKGLLGDKMLTITVGDANKPVIEPGSPIPSDESGGLDKMMGQVERIGEKAEKVMGNLESSTSTLADEKFRSDVQSSAKSLSGVLKSLDEGEGYVGKLMNDPSEAERLSRTVATLEKTAAQLENTLSHVSAIVARVEKGPGFAHDVIYGDQHSKTLTQFGAAAEEVALTLKAIREGNGPAKSLIYGDEGSEELMGNLNAMSRDMRQIVADVRAGKGTIGALLVDPSVYEDVKVLLGNVDRNKSLRALVRYSIQQGEQKPAVEVRDPEPAKPQPAKP
jgi:phospholipid/cholesterol/gamma-HCH transport system substrate-binding protein